MAGLPLQMWASGQRGPATGCCGSPRSRQARPTAAGSLGGDTHRAGGALDDLHRGLDVVGVEVGHLGRGDLADLVLGQPTDLLLVGNAGALLEAGGLLDELGRGRRLGDERERPVFVDRDLDRDHVAAHRLRLGVVGLAEVHDVDTVRTEGGTDRRRRRRGARLQLDLDQCGDLLLGRHCSSCVLRGCTSWSSRAGPALPPCVARLPVVRGQPDHSGPVRTRCEICVYRRPSALSSVEPVETTGPGLGVIRPGFETRRSDPSLRSGLSRTLLNLFGSADPRKLGSEPQTFWIWEKLSSTGVSRPKISTSALTRWASALISVIVAWSVANGPSTTITESPSSKSATSTGFLAAVAVPPAAAGPAAASALATTAGASMFSTSDMLSGTGWWAWPTKPVTEGVWRTAAHDSSVRSIRTRTYPGRTVRRTSLRWPFLISATSSVGTITSWM